MEPANEDTVLADFDDAAFSYFGRTTRFSRRGSSFLVTTENQRGQSETFTVAFTLGYHPLQQYLVAFDDGRIQALPFAWDTRGREAGGQRWFHLYPDEDITPDDPLFWTRPQQNFNHLCGDCHTTNFAKNFSAARDRFDSRWSELGNGCESCHGAGSAHVEAMQHSPAATSALSIDALRGQPAQLDQCGACHSRRVRLHEGASQERMYQTWRPELLDQGLYFVDGQIRDEVFEIGSFLQSEMAERGVTCSDCHDPHTTELKAPGNALCVRCHAPATYDTEQHYFHPSGTAGAQCVACHMPSRTYMVIDPRHDHRLAVPRPDLSDALAVPNACNGCHEDRSNAWAADAIRRHGTARSQVNTLPDTFGTALWQIRNESAAAAASVRLLIEDTSTRSIVKATWLAALSASPSPDSLSVIASELRATDPALRLGAVEALRGAPVATRLPLLVDHLQDDSLAVRLAIAPLLAGSDPSALTSEQRRHLHTLFAEYRRWLGMNGDRAAALVALAAFQLAEGDLSSARASFEEALERDETSLAAHLNYADYYRTIHDERQAEVLLRKACTLYPDSGAAHFVLGLSLVRQKRVSEALVELERAVRLAPDDSHYTYVYAVGLHSAQQVNKALSVLRQARIRFPANRQIQSALSAYCADRPGHPSCR